MTKLELVRRLRECAEAIKDGILHVDIPDNECHLEPGNYQGGDLGAVVYFIADMLE